jgi:BRCA1-A complex subunit Abraxas 1 MPN domain
MDSLNISGLTLSSLLYQVCNAHGDMEGLLFGEVKLSAEKEREAATATLQPKLFVQGALVTGSVCSFYDASGHVDIDKVTLLSQNRVIVGWFRFRRGVALKPTLREIAVHENLIAANLINAASSNSSSSSSPSLSSLSSVSGVLALLSLTHAPPHHVYAFDYRFVRLLDELDVSLNVNIENMVHSSEEEYASFSTQSPLAVGRGGAAAAAHQPDLMKAPFDNLLASFAAQTDENSALLAGLGDANAHPPHLRQLEDFVQLSLEKLQAMCDLVDESAQTVARLELAQSQ